MFSDENTKIHLRNTCLWARMEFQEKIHESLNLQKSKKEIHIFLWKEKSFVPFN